MDQLFYYGMVWYGQTILVSILHRIVWSNSQALYVPTIINYVPSFLHLVTVCDKYIYIFVFVNTSPNIHIIEFSIFSILIKPCTINCTLWHIGALICILYSCCILKKLICFILSVIILEILIRDYQSK